LDLEPGQEMGRQEEAGEEETKASDQTEDDDADDGPDVVVETPAGNDVTSTPGGTTTSAAKKNRRGRRGTKKSAKKETVSSLPVADSPPSAPQPVQSCPAVTPRRPPKVPLVEYAVESVLKHREAASFVKRTGRVVNILEFKHTRVAAGIYPNFSTNFQVNILIFNFCGSGSSAYRSVSDTDTGSDRVKGSDLFYTKMYTFGYFIFRIGPNTYCGSSMISNLFA
jgi:hypothetical protein